MTAVDRMGCAPAIVNSLNQLGHFSPLVFEMEKAMHSLFLESPIHICMPEGVPTRPSVKYSCNER